MDKHFLSVKINSPDFIIKFVYSVFFLYLDIWWRHEISDSQNLEFEYLKKKWTFEVKHLFSSFLVCFFFSLIHSYDKKKNQKWKTITNKSISWNNNSRQQMKVKEFVKLTSFWNLYTWKETEPISTSGNFSSRLKTVKYNYRLH